MALREKILKTFIVGIRAQEKLSTFSVDIERYTKRNFKFSYTLVIIFNNQITMEEDTG